MSPQAYAGRCALNVMLSITFGSRTDSIHDPIVGEGLRLSREFMNITGPVSNLVDFIPVLERLPSGIRSRGRKLHSDLVDTHGGWIKKLDGEMKSD